MIIVTQGFGSEGHTAGIMPYPEDKYLFDRMEECLNIYANFNVDYLSLLSEDSDKIQKLKNLLCIDKEYDVNPEEVVSILIKFRNNCDKRTSV